MREVAVALGSAIIASELIHAAAPDLPGAAAALLVVAASIATLERYFRPER